jgi:ketosteroid isomerase-like protein
MPVPSHHAPDQLSALGRSWIDAWNSHDLDRVLALYADDTEMTSEIIVKLGFSPTGTVHGKASLRQYWTKALSLNSGLHFELIDTFVSPDSIVVFYRNQRGATICEYLRLDSQGKIIQGSANHVSH